MPYEYFICCARRVLKAGETSWLEQPPSLARALLEAIGTGTARSRSRILSFIGCTLESARLSATPRPGPETTVTSTDSLLDACVDRALDYLLGLELVREEPVTSEPPTTSSTWTLADGDAKNPDAVATRDDRQVVYTPTSLGTALLNSSIEISVGLAVYRDLNRARKSLILESDLHLVFLVRFSPHLDLLVRFHVVTADPINAAPLYSIRSLRFTTSS